MFTTAGRGQARDGAEVGAQRAPIRGAAAVAARAGRVEAQREPGAGHEAHGEGHAAAATRSSRARLSDPLSAARARGAHLGQLQPQQPVARGSAHLARASTCSLSTKVREKAPVAALHAVEAGGPRRRAAQLAAHHQAVAVDLDARGRRSSTPGTSSWTTKPPAVS